MILGKGHLKRRTEDQWLWSARKENGFDLRSNIAEDCMANISSHVQQGVCCVLSVQYRDNMGFSSTNKYLQIRPLILDKN